VLRNGEKLVAEEFVSSFPNDAIDFDEPKVSSIVKCKTTKAEVLTLLGKANGSDIYPFIKTQGETALLYSYGHAKGSAFNMKFYNKSLSVSFNAASVATDVEHRVRRSLSLKRSSFGVDDILLSMKLIDRSSMRNRDKRNLRNSRDQQFIHVQFSVLT
jgi:hypothetical protein